MCEFDDEWDRVVCFEELAYIDGKKEGEAAASTSFADGFETGVAKGYTIGLELGFIEENVRSFLKSNSSSSDISERMKKRLELILTKCKEFPMHNSADIDFDTSHGEIKALYKACNLPPFTRAVESVSLEAAW